MKYILLSAISRAVQCTKHSGSLSARRLLSLAVGVSLLLSVVITALTLDSKALRFRPDGTFRILQINDFQDGDNTSAKSLAFLNTLLDRYRPDLVILAGDQLMYGNKLTTDQIQTALTNQLQPMEERRIPFLYTFGNHDHDHDATLDSAGQAAIYDGFRMSSAVHNGPDPGTYSKVIYGSHGSAPAMNIYMMDTGEWRADYMMSGVSTAQIEWYTEIGNSLRTAGGKAVPSLLFQHIPVKETLGFLTEVPEGIPNAVRSIFRRGAQDRYYILDTSADWVGDRNVMKEFVSCENPARFTGEYQAWVRQGDIIGAYFGHDHRNTFVGRTSDGIIMGYNGGFGFATYGDGKERFARIYDFTENDVSSYAMRTLCYSTETSPPAWPLRRRSR